MKQVCKTCKWWDTERFDWGDGIGECDLAQVVGLEPKHSESKVYVSCDYHGALVTKRDFGCNQWEERA